MEIIAGVLGGLAGLLGVAPFVWIGGKIRKMMADKGAKAFKYVLLMPPLSFILMLAAIFIFAWALPAQAWIFAIACAVVFLTAMIAYVVIQVRDTKRSKES